MKLLGNIVNIWILILLLTIYSLTVVSCEPTINIRIHNLTDEKLEIFIDGEVYLDQAMPGEYVVWEIGIIYPYYEITAKDMDGNEVYVVGWGRGDLRGKETYDVYLPPKIDIRINNMTDGLLKIFIDGEYYLTTVKPRSTVVWYTDRIGGVYEITAKDLDGNTVYNVTWTIDDLDGKEIYDVYLPPLEDGPESSDNFTGSDNTTIRQE